MNQDDSTQNPSNKRRLKLNLSSKKASDSPPEDAQPPQETETRDSAESSPHKPGPQSISFKRQSRELKKEAPPEKDEPEASPQPVKSESDTDTPANPEPKQTTTTPAEDKSAPSKLALKQPLETPAGKTGQHQSTPKGDTPPPLPNFIKQPKKSTPEKEKATNEAVEPAPEPNPKKKSAPIPSAQELEAEKNATHKKEVSGNPVATLLILALILAVLIGGGYWGVTALLKSESEATTSATTTAPPKQAPRETSSTSSPIERTQNTVKQANQETEEANRVLQGISNIMKGKKEVAPTPSTPAPEPAPSVTTQSEPAPTPAKEPDMAVVKWIRELRISGVREKGSESAMIIQGKFYKLGDYVNQDLQIRWIQFEPKKGRVIFMDSQGLAYGKKY